MARGRGCDSVAGASGGCERWWRGIHPAILSEGGLGAAPRTLARRSLLPVQLEVLTQGRLPEPIQVGAYYVVAEALVKTTASAAPT
jgi:hypothetical protein